MSLNGLDDAAVLEAFQVATGEPKGWFIIKYLSRDEIGLLSRGSGGVSEVRKAVADYGEPSILYGFLKYRRRNVILKYQPPDCSRLLQARAAVHFSAICEKLTPHDTTYEFGTVDDLNDTKLSSACALHTTNNSTSSTSSSQRRRRLGEIAEEDEEEERDRKRQSIVKEEESPSSPTNSRPTTPQKRPSSTEPPVVLDPKTIESAPKENFSSTEEPPDFSGIEEPTSPSKSEFERRLSSQTARPDLYSYATYTYGRPKVKLGPRPSAETGGTRPQTAGNFRRTSALPSGFKTSKATKKGNKDIDSTEARNPALLSPPIPEDPTCEVDIANTPLPPRPNTSSGASILSSTSTVMAGKDKRTPEKTRLMKAMKLREKKKKMAASAQDSQSTAAEADVSQPVDDATETTPAVNGEAENDEPEKVTESNGEDPQEPSIEPTHGTDDFPATPLTIRTNTHSEDTGPDSHPPSPAAASLSETGQSTKASSLSDSTDETVHPEKTKTSQADAVSDDDEADEGPEELSEIIQEAGVTLSPMGSEFPGKPESLAEQTIPEATVEPFIKEQNVGNAEIKANKDGQSQPEQVEVAGAADHVAEATEGGAKANVMASEKVESAGEEASIPHGTETSDDNGRANVVVVARRGAAGEGAKPEPVIHTTEITLPPLRGDDEPIVSSSPRVIPTSKFSTAEPKTPTTPRTPTTPSLKSKFSLQESEPPVPSIPSIVAPPNQQPAALLLQQHATHLKSPILAAPPKSARRKPAPSEPSNRGDTAIDSKLETPQSELSDPLLDDEAFMDELQSATVQEAIVVSKSPMNNMFPPSPSPPAESEPSSEPAREDQELQPQEPPVTSDETVVSDTASVRSVSQPMRGPYLAPGDVSSSSARSVSAGGAAYLHNVTRQSSNAGLQSKKSAIGSSISQRIKALEKLSSTTGGPEEQRPRSVTPSSTFHGVRASSVRQPSKSPSVVDRASSLTRQTPTPEASREGTPETPETARRDRSGSMANRLSMFELSGQNIPRGRPESVQVTSRIMRDAPQASPQRYSSATRHGDRATPDELTESPLDAKPATSAGILTESSGNPLADASNDASQDTRPTDSEKKTRRSSVDMMRSFLTKSGGENSPGGVSPANGPSSGPSSGRPSLNLSRNNTLSPNRTNSGLMSDSENGDESKGTTDKKTKGRTSSFMRRLSSSLATRNKGASANVAPTHSEEKAKPTPSVATTDSKAATITASMGDVNVQFPENLLWKRRFMCLDSRGWLILSTEPMSSASQAEKSAPGIKRYHMSELRPPQAPDVEVQELPNSVVLDLMQGSCLQIACEDRRAQVSVLAVLEEAHQKHGST